MTPSKERQDLINYTSHILREFGTEFVHSNPETLTCMGILMAAECLNEPDVKMQLDQKMKMLSFKCEAIMMEITKEWSNAKSEESHGE